MKKPKIRVKNSTTFPTKLARRLARAVWDDRDLPLPLLLELKLWTSKKPMPRSKSRYESIPQPGGLRGVKNMVVGFHITIYGREDSTDEGTAALLRSIAWSAVLLAARRRQGEDRALRSKLAQLVGDSHNGPGPDGGIRRNDLNLMHVAIFNRVMAKLGIPERVSSGPGQEVAIGEFITNNTEEETP